MINLVTNIAGPLESDGGTLILFRDLVSVLRDQHPQDSSLQVSSQRSPS